MLFFRFSITIGSIIIRLIPSPTQGYLQLLEPSVTVIARSKDVSIAETAAEGARRQYNEISGRDVEVYVDGSLSDGRYVV